MMQGDSTTDMQTPLHDVTNSLDTAVSHSKLGKDNSAVRLRTKNTTQASCWTSDEFMKQDSTICSTDTKRSLLDIESCIKDLEPITDRLCQRSQPGPGPAAIVEYPTTLPDACRLIDQQKEDIVRTLEVGQELLLQLAQVQAEHDSLVNQLLVVKEEKGQLEEEARALRTRLPSHHAEARCQTFLLKEMLQEKEAQLQQEKQDRLHRSHLEKLERDKQEMSYLSSFVQSPRLLNSHLAEDTLTADQRYLEVLRENSQLRTQLQDQQDLQDQLAERDTVIRALRRQLSRPPTEPLQPQTAPPAALEDGVASLLTSPASCISLRSPLVSTLLSAARFPPSSSHSPALALTDTSGSSTLLSVQSRRLLGSHPVLLRFTQALQEVKYHYCPSRILNFNDTEERPEPTSTTSQLTWIPALPPSLQGATTSQSPPFQAKHSSVAAHSARHMSPPCCTPTSLLRVPRMRPATATPAESAASATTCTVESALSDCGTDVTASCSLDFDSAADGFLDQALRKATNRAAPELMHSTFPGAEGSSQATPGPAESLMSAEESWTERRTSLMADVSPPVCLMDLEDKFSKPAGSPALSLLRPARSSIGTTGNEPQIASRESHGESTAASVLGENQWLRDNVHALNDRNCQLEQDLRCAESALACKQNQLETLAAELERFSAYHSQAHQRRRSVDAGISQALQHLETLMESEQIVVSAVAERQSYVASVFRLSIYVLVVSVALGVLRKHPDLHGYYPI